MDAGSLLVCDFLISYAASPAPLSLPEATASRDGEKMGGDQASTTQPNKSPTMHTDSATENFMFSFSLRTLLLG